MGPVLGLVESPETDGILYTLSLCLTVLTEFGAVPTRGMAQIEFLAGEALAPLAHLDQLLQRPVLRTGPAHGLPRPGRGPADASITAESIVMTNNVYRVISIDKILGEVYHHS